MRDSGLANILPPAGDLDNNNPIALKLATTCTQAQTELKLYLDV